MPGVAYIYVLAATLPATVLTAAGHLGPQQPTAHFGTFARHTKSRHKSPTLQKSQNIADAPL